MANPDPCDEGDLGILGNAYDYLVLVVNTLVAPDQNIGLRSAKERFASL